MNGNIGVYFILICVITISEEFGYRNSSGTQEAIIHTLARYRRQSTQCKDSEITCSSGGCVSEESECDGKPDCQDGSDEGNCANFQCTSNLFRCAYGACIKRSAMCDGKKDCMDNSDETSSLCIRATTKAPVCGSGQFQCDSNDCISEEKLCDGKADCPDSSDETPKACSELPCNPRIFFRCDYGACLAKSVKCNKVKDCFDGSDERNCPITVVTPPTIVTPTPITKKPTPSLKPTEPPPPGGCLIPNHPNNGEYRLGLEKATPGEYAPMYKALVLKCKEPQYKPYPPTLGIRAVLPYCIDGKWFPTPPTCALACSPLLSTTTTKVTCKHGDKILDNCDNPVQNTVAVAECESFHEMPEVSLNPDIVCKDGSWDYPVPQCLPVCGDKRAKGVANIIGGTITKKSDYPWHVGVYNATNDNICGGSIISRRVVLSAAHCFTDQDGKLYPFEDYKIVAGKYYRNYDDPRDHGAQESAIEHIYIAPKYKAMYNYYEADLAIIVLKERLKVTGDVQPVCIDWRNQFEQQQLVENNVGIVVGWGQTVLGSEPSMELKALQVLYKPYSDCYDQVPPEFRKFLTFDKICAAYLSAKQPVCLGDNGGGLTFQRNQNRFYIRGIVSTSPSSKETGTVTCDQNQYATYTMISKYIDLIRRIENQNRS
uniref:Peptidase S1 domain-containing protein n=2 Tax=Photinus pyralis TaxID=7054 RepID=A0A1Y1LR62_PHOPY